MTIHIETIRYYILHLVAFASALVRINPVERRRPYKRRLQKKKGRKLVANEAVTQTNPRLTLALDDLITSSAQTVCDRFG